jgi:hypothetical protein
MQWVKGEVYRVLVGKPGRKRPLGRCISGKIILQGA